MKINDVQSTVLEIPVQVPHLDETIYRPLPVVRVETSDGTVGHGQAGHHWAAGVQTVINRQLNPLLTGKNPLETEDIWTDSQLELNSREQTGAWSSAMSAVDIALWDITGKHFGEPIWRLLGGARESVPAYATFGMKSYSIDQLNETARELVSDGHDKLKMKVGIDNATNPLEDAKRVRAVREAVGEDIELMIDANNEFPINRALDLCRRIEDCAISWFEEPLYGNDVKLMASLRQRTSIPISAGQNEGNKLHHLAMMEEGAIDISQPNVCWGGGYTETKKVAALAEAHHLDIANGGGHPFHNMHLQGGAANGSRVEFHHIHWEMAEQIYTGLPTPADGSVQLPQSPGLGYSPDPDAIERFEVDPDAGSKIDSTFSWAIDL